jgi:hypothetical protein
MRWVMCGALGLARHTCLAALPWRRSAARYLRMVHMGDILFWATVGVLVVIAVLLVLSF